MKRAVAVRRGVATRPELKPLVEQVDGAYATINYVGCGNAADAHVEQ